MNIRRIFMLYLILIQCLLYQCQPIAVTNARCSWGSWLPWNCTCCGNYIDTDVYRIRAKCCHKTYECAIVRTVAVNISDENAFGETGTCSKNCDNNHPAYNGLKCDSHKMDLNDLNMSSKILSCTNETCIGTLTTTTTTTTTKTTTTITTTTQTTPLSNHKSTSTPTSPPTIQASRTTWISTTSASVTPNTILYRSTTTVGNVKSSDTKYAVILGSIFGGIPVIIIIVVGVVLCYRKHKENKKMGEQTEETKNKSSVPLMNWLNQIGSAIFSYLLCWVTRKASN